MIYIEEITDSDDEKELIEEDKNDIENDNSSTGTSVPHNITTDATATANSSVSPPPLLFQMENLPSCPTIIGGGSAIVTVAFLGEITTVDAVCSKRLVYVFGGCDRSGSGGLSNRLHCFDFETKQWKCNLKCKGNPPSPRFGHSMIAFNSKLYIYGGQGVRESEAIKSSDNSGTSTSTNERSSSSSSSTCSSNDDGGEIEMECFSSLHYLDLNTMTWGEIDQDECEAEADPQLQHDTGHHKHNHNHDHDHCWPKRRNSHGSAVIGSKMVIFGGANEVDGPMNDLWVFDLLSQKWQQHQQHETITSTRTNNDSGCHDSAWPCKREMLTLTTTSPISASSVVVEDHDSKSELELLESEENLKHISTNEFVYLLGGRREDGTICQDFFVYHFEEKKWTKLESPPSPRCAHSSVLTRNRYIDVYGGWDGAGIIFNDFISYDIEMNSWSCSTNCSSRSRQKSSSTSTSNSTSMGGKEKSCSSVGARFAHCACPLWGDTFILAGGVNASSDLSDIVTIQRA